MEQQRNRPTLRSVYAALTRAAIATALIPLFACSSKPSSKLPVEKTAERDPALSTKTILHPIEPATIQGLTSIAFTTAYRIHRSRSTTFTRRPCPMALTLTRKRMSRRRRSTVFEASPMALSNQSARCALTRRVGRVRADQWVPYDSLLD